MIFRHTLNDYRSRYPEWADWFGLMDPNGRDPEALDPTEWNVGPDVVIHHLTNMTFDGGEVGALADIVCLRDWLDEITPVVVARARENGPATWEEIGRALGISKQAAQQRFGPTADSQ